MAQDSSKADFWNVRYQNNVTPWDCAGLPPDFDGHAGRCLQGKPQAKVLIPGCGTAYELAWLRRQGVAATAFDFSAEAVSRARAAFPACAGSILEADFFGPAIDGQWDWVYERAFLCALPPALAARYAERMASLIPSGGLLGGYFFLREQVKGPPFGTSLSNLQQALQPYFMLEEQLAVSGSLPVFAPDEFWLSWRRL